MTARLMVVVFLGTAALPALAEEVPLPPLTPKGEYLVMTQDDATTSSKCIGDPITPMCAVETLLACFVRNKTHLCQTAMGVGYDKVPDFSRDLPWPSIVYRVVRREVLTDRTFPWRPKRDLEWRPNEPSMEAGDVRIDLLQRECDVRILPNPCGPSQFPLAYIVRRQGGIWAVVDWRPPYFHY